MMTKTTLQILTLVTAFSVPSFAQSFIDFEFIPGGVPSDGLLISTQFQATLGFSFSLEGGGVPRLAQVGAPQTAFVGFGAPDTPAPGVDAGQFFLTDDGSVGAAPPPMLVDFVSPVSGASGIILDIDFSEEWTVEAKDAMGLVLDTVILGTAGNGSASQFTFDVGAPLIAQLRIAFTGSGAGIGLAFDNFKTTSPGAGTGQPNSTDARLEINRQGENVDAGPFDVVVFAGSNLDLEWSGPAGFPVLLLAGPINTSGFVVPCFGSVDLGTPPTFSDLILVFDGSTFPQSLFYTLDVNGNLSQSTIIPPAAAGSVIGFQGAVGQPVGSPCISVFTAAFEVTIL